MSESNRSDSSTQYLLFKIAILCKDQELGIPSSASYQLLRLMAIAIGCLNIISSDLTKDPTILYACVLEAQRTGEHLLAVMSLQRVLSKYNYGAPNSIHLPALLRYILTSLLLIVLSYFISCTARLLIQEVEKGNSQIKEGANEICELLDGGA